MAHMKSYIVTCRTLDGDLKERHIEAHNHLAAVKVATADGLTVIAIDRDDGSESKDRSLERLKGIIGTLLVGLLLAAVCVIAIWWRYMRHS